ncbi:MAG: Uma2 family endonuclease [Cyanobacteria bacterium P01_A01_bin.114]
MSAEFSTRRGCLDMASWVQNLSIRANLLGAKPFSKVQGERMVNPLPVLNTVPIETWVEATWEEFLTFADDPTLMTARFYYDQGYMRIEMAPLGSAHGQDITIVSTVLNLYAALKNIPIKGLTNTSFRKLKIREAQPDLAFYIDKDLTFPPRNNAPIDLNILASPTLIVEIAASSLDDDRERKLSLYQKMGVKECWVVDVAAGKILAWRLSQTSQTVIRESQVLPQLQLALVEEAILRSHTEDDGAISRWLIETLTNHESS